MITYQAIPVVHQNRIKDIIKAKKGKSAAARIFECARQSITRAAEGLPVHPYLALRLAKTIAERDAAGKSP